MVVIDSKTDSKITVVHNDAMTTLIRINMSFDATGIYECVAGNILGESQNRIYVHVLCKWWYM